MAKEPIIKIMETAEKLEAIQNTLKKYISNDTNVTTNTEE